MRKTLVAEIPSFLGGVNQGLPASAIKADQVVMAVNFKPSMPAIRTRGGLRRLFTFTAPNGASEPVKGLKSALRGGVKGLLALGQINASWYPPDYAVPVELGEVGPSEDTEPWSIAPWNETVFAAREADGLRIIQLDPDVVDGAGVAAPTGALVASDAGAGGELPPGDFYWTYAFRDSRTGATSSKSPASNVLSLADAHSADLTGFDTPPHARFDQYVIYRSFPNGTGEEFETEIIDIADVPHNDNIPIEGQTNRSQDDNDEPPEDAVAVVYWQARLWVITTRLLYPSKILNPEAFSPREQLEVGTDDTEDLIDIVATPERLIVGKRRSIWSVTGTGATNWAIRPIDLERGVSARRSMTVVGGAVVWQGDDDYYISDGVNPGVPFSGREEERKLKPFFANRVPGASAVSVAVPNSDGVLLGLASRVTVRELADDAVAEEDDDENPVP